MLRSLTGSPSAVCQFRVATRPKPPSTAASAQVADTKVMPDPPMKLITGAGKAANSWERSSSSSMVTAGLASVNGRAAAGAGSPSWGLAMIREAASSAITAMAITVPTIRSRTFRTFFPPAKGAPPF